MASPDNPGSPTSSSGGALSPEEAERLASSFRPSWELDEAPFTGAGTLSASDLLALQGGGTLAEVTDLAGKAGGFGPGATMPRTPEGTGPDATILSAPPAPTAVAAAPDTKAIADETVVTAPPPMDLLEIGEPIAGAHGPTGTAVLGMEPRPLEPPRPQPAAVTEVLAQLEGGRSASARGADPLALTEAAAVDTAVFRRNPFGGSKTRLLAMAGGAGALVLILVIWAATRSSSDEAPSTATTPSAAASADPKPATVTPPQPTETATSNLAAQLATTTASPGWSPAPQATAKPQPTSAPPPAATYSPPPVHTAAPAPRPTVASAPAPAPKPHAKTTIVRDVPF